MSSNTLSGYNIYSRTYSSSDPSFGTYFQTPDSAGFSSITVPVYDAYQSCTQCGVYMLNYQNAPGIIPVPVSLTNLTDFNMQTRDDGYIIYPGFACQLFYDTGYTGTKSYILFNNETTPQVFNCDNSSIGGNKIQISGSGGPYPSNTTNSIKIWCNGVYLAGGKIS